MVISKPALRTLGSTSVKPGGLEPLAYTIVTNTLSATTSPVTTMTRYQHSVPTKTKGIAMSTRKSHFLLFPLLLSFLSILVTFMWGLTNKHTEIPTVKLPAAHLGISLSAIPGTPVFREAQLFGTISFLLSFAGLNFRGHFTWRHFVVGSGWESRGKY